MADGRVDDALSDQEAEEEADGEEPVHAPAARHLVGEGADPDPWLRHVRKAVLAAGPAREGGEFEEEEHLREGERDHREVDAGAAQRQHADADRHDGGGERAQDRREDDARHQPGCHQIRGDEAAEAVERRLAEGEQAGEAEEQVEAEPEHAPDQHAPGHIGPDADEWQQERQHDERERGDDLRQPADRPVRGARVPRGVDVGEPHAGAPKSRPRTGASAGRMIFVLRAPPANPRADPWP